jgi:hypothetical protein
MSEQVYCPACSGSDMVSRYRLVRQSVDLTTGDVMREDSEGWTHEYECGCGHDWTDRTRPAPGYAEPTP